MGGNRTKLLLAVLWLVPGVGLLLAWAVTGVRHGAFALNGRTVPADVLMVVFGGVNALRYALGRGGVTTEGRFRDRRNRPHRLAGGSPEPDPAFDFGDPDTPRQR